MKHSIILKFIAIFLAACGLTVALGSAFGVGMMAEAGLYETDYDAWYQDVYREKAHSLAKALAESYAARSRGGFTGEELEAIGWGNSWKTIGLWHELASVDWCYTITSSGSVQETTYNKRFVGGESFTFRLCVEYPQKISSAVGSDARYRVESANQTRFIYTQTVISPEYTVTVWFAPDSIGQYRNIPLELYGWLMQLRYLLIAGLGGGLLLAAAFLVYLCCAAGKKQADDAPRPGGLNRLPLDLYSIVTGFVCYVAACGTVEIVEEFIFYGTGINWGWFSLGVTLVFLGAICVVGFLMAVAAQWKMGLRWLWKRTLIGWCCCKLWGGIRAVAAMLCKLYRLLPLVWRYLLLAVGMAAVPVLLGIFYLATPGVAGGFWLLLFLSGIVLDIVILCYGAYAFGTILKGAKNMAAGDLYGKIDTRYLFGSYKTCGEDLNALADVAVEAAKKQMRSERMKTELITNVSHDIKTPLTSIINYIDLLQKAQTPEQSGEYLKVLERQSYRLKKLIEDLIEMSKAATGDMAVEMRCMDAAEAISQALGEFSDKLTAQSLTIMVRRPDGPVPVMADGRLVWRTLSNLLSNVVKYALPGTRVYVDVENLENRVQVSIKNISREALNVSAEELTERFVRGDAARNSEGSGLGLNIAKSLMQLQKGDLELLIDGDLFKVTLTFPKAS